MLNGLRNQLAKKINTFSFFSSANSSQVPQVIKVNYNDLVEKNSEKLYG